MAIKQIDKIAKERYLQLCKVIASSTSIDPFETKEAKAVRMAINKAEFNEFVKYYFSHYAESETPDFHTEIANMVAKNVSIKVWMKWAREHAKSVVATVLLPLWLWIRKDIDFMLVIGQNEDKAKVLLGDLQAEFEHNPRLINDFGQQKTLGSWEDGFFVTKNGFIAKAFGMGQDPRGIRVGARRPDYIVCDDWETRESAKNPKRQDEMAEWLLRGVIPAMGVRNRRVLIAQNHWTERMIFSKIVEENKTWLIHQVNAYNPETYEPRWKNKYHPLYFKEREDEIGKVRAMAEYNNEPHTEGKLFIDEYFQYDKLPQLRTFDAIVGRWDVAFAGSKTSDYNAIRIWGLKDGKKWLIATFVKQCKVTVALKWIAWFQKQLPIGVSVQVGFEAQFWNEEIYRCINEVQTEFKITLNLIKIDRDTTNKYDRMMEMLPQYQNSRVIYNEALKSNNDFQVGLFQLKGLEPGYKTKDDAPDADKYAFDYLDLFESAKQTTYRNQCSSGEQKILILMIFLTEPDFLTVITQDHIDEVTDGDITLLDSAELTAIGEFTGYINIRYDPVLSLDANVRIPIVVAMLVDMALYHAHARITPDNIPTLREKRYNNAITWCEKVASGFIAPDLPIKTVTPSESTPLRYGSTGEKQDMYF